MIHSDPAKRPSAFALAQDPVLGKKSRAQLRKELNEEKFKNQVLSRKLEEAQEKQPSSLQAPGKKSRLLGGKVGMKIGRSMSVQYF